MALLLILLPAVLWVFLRGCSAGNRDWKLLGQYRYAHRGLHDKPAVPENSMAAFRRAVERGFGSELDVHLMKDGNLAVIHDASLLRTAGAAVEIEDLTKEDLQNYLLEESEERIPLLEDVLALYNGQAPLIVELKPERGNHQALASAVSQRLDAYDGPYCVESFDPRAMAWFRKHRPAVCRGQLAENFVRSRSGNLSPFLRFCLTHCLLNILSRPHFVAYNFTDRKLWSFRLLRWLHRPGVAFWTLETPEQLTRSEEANAVCIFEKFLP